MARFKPKALARLDNLTLPMQIRAINLGLVKEKLDLSALTGVPVEITGDVVVRSANNED